MAKVKELRWCKISFLVLMLLFTSIVLASGKSEAATYYISTTGNDSNPGTSASPWATFSHAMSYLNPGDTLYLKDGTYNQSLYVTVSGTSGNPITIKAFNDGGAIVDGTGLGQYNNPLTIENQSYIQVEGIVFQNGDGAVVRIKSSNNITLKRVSGYNANEVLNNPVFDVVSSTNVLLEDCAASGTGRKMFSIFSSSYVTLRRCWGFWESSDNSFPAGTFNIYGSDHNIIENSIAAQDPTATGRDLSGFSITRNPNNLNASNYNKLYGNVAYNFDSSACFSVAGNGDQITGNSFVNNTAINCQLSFRDRMDDSLTVNYFTAVNFVTDGYYMDKAPQLSSISATLTNSVFSGGTTYGLHVVDPATATLTHSYNNLYNITTNYHGTSAGTGETYVNPSYDTTTYGKGAYLIKPSNLATSGEGGTYMGAEVLYRYVDGTLTSTSLWPWPMEARICAETGYSVTYETGYTGCTKGDGLWKTLNGVYPDGVYTGDTIAPAPPFAK